MERVEDMKYRKYLVQDVQALYIGTQEILESMKPKLSRSLEKVKGELQERLRLEIEDYYQSKESEILAGLG